jgi:hypothetical protein
MPTTHVSEHTPPFDAPGSPTQTASFAARRQSPDRDIRWIMAMVGAIAVPAAITLATVRSEPDPLHPDRADSPYGYTVSLLLFALPILLLVVWRVKQAPIKRHLRALLWASGVIASVGFLLDLVFGHTFFIFRNSAATIGLRLPAWSFTTMEWIPSYLPVEEFGFYILGSLFVLAVYQWADADWLCDYSVDDYLELANQHAAIMRVHWRSLIWWGALVVAGIAIKRLGPEPIGLPGYFIFIMVLGFLPSFLFLQTIRTFVNWRAFAFAYVNLTLISLLWEATLGVPYEWWNYNHSHMLGIKIFAWSALPIEAVLLWLVVAWDCIIAYEIFRVFFHMDRDVRAAMLGTAQGRREQGAGRA